MPNQLAEDVKKAAAPTAPSDDQIKAELEREREARRVAEQRAGFFQGAAAAEWERARKLGQAPSAAATITDPFAKFAAEDPLLDPEKRARLLADGARDIARQESIRVGQELEARRQMERWQDKTEGAMDAFSQAHPEILSDSENFAGAAMRAKVRAESKGMNLSPAGMLNLAYQIYNEGKAPASQAPYTEGASAAGPHGAKKEDEPVTNMATEEYGADPKDFMDERKVPLDRTPKVTSMRGT